MKIGIMTFHRVSNIGAVLQASALQMFINDNIGDCEIIDYVSNKEALNYKGIRVLVHRIRQITGINNGWSEITKDIRYYGYRKKYMRISHKLYRGDNEIRNTTPHYDIIISGSDQILNTELTGNSEAYYLKFFPEIEKISYASSFGREEISETEKSLIKETFLSFKAISVREKQSQPIIQELIGVNPCVVLDPVFLLNSEQWKGRCNEHIATPDKYIFVYSMEVSSDLENVVMTLNEKYNIPVLVVRGGGKTGKIIGAEDTTCGPSEFLRYIRDAQFVVTNSFHGAAFSLIFQKNLFLLPHSKRNVRIINLADLIGESDKIIYQTMDMNLDEKLIEGKRVYKRMLPLINRSIEYLNTNLTD